MRAGVFERMGNAAWPLYERAGRAFDGAIAQLEDDFALHDEERFIFTMMNMRGRSVIRRYARFAERINATGLFSGGQNAINISDARIGGALPGAGMDGFG
jgi:hypothetical protein